MCLAFTWTTSELNVGMCLDSASPSIGLGHFYAFATVDIRCGSGLGLVQDPDDLLLAEPLPLHRAASPRAS
jgi:hypothetical protein